MFFSLRSRCFTAHGPTVFSSVNDLDFSADDLGTTVLLPGFSKTNWQISDLFLHCTMLWVNNIFTGNNKKLPPKFRGRHFVEYFDPTECCFSFWAKTRVVANTMLATWCLQDVGSISHRMNSSSSSSSSLSPPSSLPSTWTSTEWIIIFISLTFLFLSHSLCLYFHPL